jgi:hypothetical protein
MEQINYLKLKFHSIFYHKSQSPSEYSPLKGFYDSPLPHSREYSNHGASCETHQILLSPIDVPILNFTSSNLPDSPDQPKQSETVWSTKISNWRLLIFSPSSSDQESQKENPHRAQLKISSFSMRMSQFATYLQRVVKPSNQTDQEASDALMQ